MSKCTGCWWEVEFEGEAIVVTCTYITTESLETIDPAQHPGVSLD